MKRDKIFSGEILTTDRDSVPIKDLRPLEEGKLGFTDTTDPAYDLNVQLVLAVDFSTDPHRFKLCVSDSSGDSGLRIYDPETLPPVVLDRFLLAHLRTRKMVRPMQTPETRIPGASRLFVTVGRISPLESLPPEDRETGWYLGKFFVGDDPTVYDLYTIILSSDEYNKILDSRHTPVALMDRVRTDSERRAMLSTALIKGGIAARGYLANAYGYASCTAFWEDARIGGLRAKEM
jgi:hypothetical protein